MSEDLRELGVRARKLLSATRRFLRHRAGGEPPHVSVMGVATQMLAAEISDDDPTGLAGFKGICRAIVANAQAHGQDRAFIAGALVDAVNEAFDEADAINANPGGQTP